MAHANPADLSLADKILQDPEAKLIIQQIRTKIRQQPISDLFDHQRNQYVDLVLEGGGVLGIALLGYVHALEQAGIRFMNIGGSSAGSIVATLLAAADQPDQAKAIRLLHLLEVMPIKSFMDGGKDARNFLNRLRYNPEGIVDKIIPLSKIALKKFAKAKLGINSGIKFEEWLSQCLEHELKVPNQSVLRERMQLKVPLKVADTHHPQSDHADFSSGTRLNRLAVIASDVTTESKVEFPKHAALYWPTQSERISLAKFVRASMSIPLVFEPVVATLQDHEQDMIRNEWQEQLGYYGKLPERAYLVDGSVVSNFPINVFHLQNAVPLCPTLGVKLDTDRQKPKDVSNLGKYVGAIFDTARHLSDYSFLSQHPDYKHLVAYIDLSEKQHVFVRKGWKKVPAEKNRFHWLDFDMDTETQFALFMRGMQAAKRFICNESQYKDENVYGFNWQRYKELRAVSLAQFNKPVDDITAQAVEQAKINAGLGVSSSH